MIGEVRRSSVLALYVAVACAATTSIIFGIIFAIGCDGEECVVGWPVGLLAVCTGAVLLALLPGLLGEVGFWLMFIAVSAAMLLGSDLIAGGAAGIAVAVAVVFLAVLIVAKRQQIGSFYRRRTRSHA